MRSYLKPHLGRLAFAVACMLVVSGCTALFAHLMKPLFDEVLTAESDRLLYLLPGVIVGLFFIKGLADYLQNYQMQFIGQRIIADLQQDLYRHLTYMDLAFYRLHTTAALSSRFIFDLHRLRDAVGRAITGIMRDVTLIIGLSANLFHKDWRLALVSMTVFPLVIIPISKLGKRMRKYSTGTQEATGDLSQLLNETFAYNRQVKTYTMEEREINRADDNINHVFRLLVKAARVQALSSPLVELIGAASLAGVVFYAGLQVREGNLTQGDFMSFITSLLLLYRPIKGLTNINNTLQDGLAAAQRTFNLMDHQSTVKEKPTATNLKVTNGTIEFEKVSYAYPDGTHALKDVSMTINQGETVAVVGPSGAGKSTMLNLIPRFFDPSQGRVLIDGTDLTDVSLNSLRQHIALVTQEVALFYDTIYNNIAYGNPSASEEEIVQAAKDAAAHDFISQQENGYNTMVGEAGINLSGGQRQRISIARALLKNAPILLLDEATSSLDTKSERQVQKALERLMKGRTTLIVAHRLSTVIGADRICVLSEGKIVESGTHDKLLAHQGAYATLYKMQAEG